MTRVLNEEEENLSRPGQLDEGEKEARQIAGSGGPRGPAFRLRTTATLTCRRVARTSAAPRFSARIVAGLPGQARRINLAPFHLEHDFVSRERTGWTLPAACRRGRKVAVFPASRQDVARVKKVGTYNQECRVWTVSSGHRFLRTRRGRALQSDLAAVTRDIWRSGKGAARTRRSAAGYQAYIERFTLDENARSTEIEADELGLISMGNIGNSLADRLRYWKLVDEFEERHDSRLQSRIVFELPHWVTDAERRKIVERFGQLFADRGLGYWVVVHRPGPEGDQRNFHGHLAYHDRPIIGHTVDFVPGPDDRMQVIHGEPLFAATKDRTAQGRQWVEFLRRAFAQIVNDVLVENVKRTRQMPPWFYFPGSYSDLGIDIEPQKHLGARGFAMLRKGMATKRVIENLDALEAGIAAREDLAIRSIRQSIARQQELIEAMPVASEGRSSALEEFERIATEASNILRILSELQKLQTAPDMEQTDELLSGLLEESAIAGIDLPNDPEMPVAGNSGTSLHPAPLPPSHATDRRIALITLANLCLLHRLEVNAVHLDALLVEGQLGPTTLLVPSKDNRSAFQVTDRLHVPKSAERTALLLGAQCDAAGQWSVTPGTKMRAHRHLIELFDGSGAATAALAEAAYQAQVVDLQSQAAPMPEKAVAEDQDRHEADTPAPAEVAESHLPASNDGALIEPPELPAPPPKLMSPAADVRFPAATTLPETAAPASIAGASPSREEPSVSKVEKPKRVRKPKSQAKATASVDVDRAARDAEKVALTQQSSSKQTLNSAPTPSPESSPTMEVTAPAIVEMHSVWPEYRDIRAHDYVETFKDLQRLIAEAAWMKEAGSPERPVERVGFSIFVRIAEVRKFEIKFDHDHGWRVLATDEIPPGIPSDWSFKGKKPPYPPEFWLDVLKTVVHRTALCIDPEEVCRMVVATGLSVTRSDDGMYRLDDGPARLELRADGGAFRSHGISERLEKLYQALLAKRPAIERIDPWDVSFSALGVTIPVLAEKSMFAAARDLFKNRIGRGTDPAPNPASVRLVAGPTLGSLLGVAEAVARSAPNAVPQASRPVSPESQKLPSTAGMPKLPASDSHPNLSKRSEDSAQNAPSARSAPPARRRSHGNER